MVEVKVVNQWLQYGMQEYCCQFYEGWGESMSAIRFWTMEKGNLTHLCYIFSMPEPLGTEFKTVTCSVTRALLFIEVQIVN